MEAVEKKKYVWVKPDRKMTMDELWARFEYDPDHEEDENPAYERAFYDRYGNPTYNTLCAMYEDEHDIGESLTWEEFCAELDEWRTEADNEKY